VGVPFAICIAARNALARSFFGPTMLLIAGGEAIPHRFVVLIVLRARWHQFFPPPPPPDG
jgi:hypothetical protein